MTNAPKRVPVVPAELSPEQRAERARNEDAGGAEDESTDSDADSTVGNADASARGGTRDAGTAAGSNRTNDRDAQQEEGGGGGYAEEREDTDEASGEKPGMNAGKA